MNLRPRTILRIVLIIIVIALFLRNYVLQRDIKRTRDQRPTYQENFSRQSTRDLSQDDLLGGHTLKRHVAKTDAELRDRLEHERISAASTYTDRAAAERAVAATLRQNQDKLREWLKKPGRHPNLVLDYDSDQPIGRTLRRGEIASVPCSHAVVVLSYIESAGVKLSPDNNYYVLTSYPQCGTEPE
jgi:hypothetical protein